MWTISPNVQRLVLSALAPVVELLAPPRCGICDCEGALLCYACRDLWIPAQPEPVPATGLRAAAALGPYEGGLGAAIRTAKYGGVPGLARELGAALRPVVTRVTRNAPYQATLVPIPTDQSRVHERGKRRGWLAGRQSRSCSYEHAPPRHFMRRTVTSAPQYLTAPWQPRKRSQSHLPLCSLMMCARVGPPCGRRRGRCTLQVSNGWLASAWPTNVEGASPSFAIIGI